MRALPRATTGKLKKYVFFLFEKNIFRQKHKKKAHKSEKDTLCIHHLDHLQKGKSTKRQKDKKTKRQKTKRQKDKTQKDKTHKNKTQKDKAQKGKYKKRQKQKKAKAQIQKDLRGKTRMPSASIILAISKLQKLKRQNTRKHEKAITKKNTKKT